MILPGFDVHQDFGNFLMNGERHGQGNGTEPAIHRRVHATPNATGPTRARAGIDAAVYTNVGTIETHRKDIKYARELVALLMAQLKDAAGSRDALQDLITENTDPGAKRVAMLRAVALPVHASTLRDLSTALKNLIPLERQAYNIDEKPPEDSYEELLDRALADAPAGIG